MPGVEKRAKRKAAWRRQHRNGATAPSTREDFTAEQDARFRWYELHYDLDTLGLLRGTSKPLYLGDRSFRKCRYCNRTAPEVKFRKIAHAFPEQIGNHALRDHAECDTCNEHFARTIDNDFSKWSHPFRSMGRIRGKKGIPSYRAKTLRVDGYSSESLRIFIQQGASTFVDSPEKKTFTVRIERQPYVPLGVYKSLVKMAIAVMPDDEAELWDAHKRWLLEKDYGPGPGVQLVVGIQRVAGPVPNSQIPYFLFKRKPAAQGVPRIVFSVQFSSVILQLNLWHNETDVPVNQRVEMCSVPNPWGSRTRERMFGNTVTAVLDLSSMEVVRGDVESMTFRYEGTEPVPGREAESLYAGWKGWGPKALTHQGT